MCRVHLDGLRLTATLSKLGLPMPAPCVHRRRKCLNQYELIRKYRCATCREIMICECDREIGERFLPHQLKRGSEYETRAEALVTLGFQPRVCSECRGSPADVAPVAAIYGRTSKVERYYWREIAFERMRRTAEIEDDEIAVACVEREVIEHFKAFHERQPKYIYNEVSQDAVLKETDTEIIKVSARQRPGSDRRVLIEHAAGDCSAEEFAGRYFAAHGYHVLPCESRPFHVLFGVYMYLLVQDVGDPLQKLSMFGSRTAFDAHMTAPPIRTFLPKDFGTPGYYRRRRREIKKHLAGLDDSDWLFDYWAGSSDSFREYLCAHRPDDVRKARLIRSIIGIEDLRKILDYLVQDYWHHYLGWPDLLVYRPGEWFFVEVKSSKDKLSEEQKRWILENKKQLGFRFRLFKIMKVSTQKSSHLQAQ